MTRAVPSSAGAWWLAARPSTLWAVHPAIVAGTGIAASKGEARLALAATALVGAAALQILANLVNDAEDFVRGADGPDRLGPLRATQQGWLTLRQVRRGAWMAFLAALLCGLLLFHAGGWPILAIGLTGALTAVAYTAGPRPLAYHGLGDLAVFVFFGPVAVWGVHRVQGDGSDPLVWWAGTAVGLGVTAILVVNNLRDRHSDARAGKRTLVVRLGQPSGRAQHALTLLGGHVVVLVAVITGVAPASWLLAGAALPLALREVWGVSTRDGAALNPHLGGTARAAALHGVLLGVGAAL